VTESTPFGLHNLELAYTVTSGMEIPVGVVINQSDGKDKETRQFCDEQGSLFLSTIPFERRIAEIQGSGDLISRRDPCWKEQFIALGRACQSRMEGICYSLQL